VPTDRAALLLAALLLTACGGGADAAADPQFDENGNPIGVAPAPAAGAARALPAEVLADVDTVILREVFSYSGGPRDPFLSLVGTETSGPAVSDLELAAIYYVGGNTGLTAAVLREKVSGRRYTVRMGQRLGRLYVASITEKDIWFTSDDFGVQRRESLTLRKQEDEIR
jgi:hypothetical protein